MKKFIYVAMMVLTVGLMASCGNGNKVVTEPVINEQEATINGKHYDNEVYKCWLWKYWCKFTFTGWAASNQSEEESGEEYLWLTEFDAQRIKAEWDYATNFHASQHGNSVKVESSSSITEQKGKNEGNCYGNQE